MTVEAELYYLRRMAMLMTMMGEWAELLDPKNKARSKSMDPKTFRVIVWNARKAQELFGQEYSLNAIGPEPGVMQVEATADAD